MPHVSLRPGLSVFRFSRLLECDQILHFVSTRGGGQSLPPYASLNLSFRVGDDTQVVAANRRLLFDGLGISSDAVVAGKQVHGTRVQVVESTHRGRGSADWESAFDDTDALVTREQGICLMVLAADCVPVLIYDPRTGAVGAAHAGWRGTVADVVGRMVRTMEAAFGSRPSDLLACIGPSIGPDEYEVGPGVIDQVRSAYVAATALLQLPADQRNVLILRFIDGQSHREVAAILETSTVIVRRMQDHALEALQKVLSSNGMPDFEGRTGGRRASSRLDLWTANALRLQGAGVPKEQIEVAGVSSYRELGRYFSERRDGAPTGRFGAGIMLRG